MVAIRNVDTGLVREVTTNERGFYNAPFLPIGRYRLTATLAAFGPVTRDKIDVRLKETLAVNFRLDPTAREEVTVVAERPPVNTRIPRLGRTTRPPPRGRRSTSTGRGHGAPHSRSTA